MLLSEIYEHLTYGELNQVSLGTSEAGSISEADYPRLIANINLGLVELYKRFPIKQKSLLVELYPQIGSYTLHNDYAVSNTTSTQPIKYIIDSEYEPYTNDLIMVDEVFTEIGEEVPLNDTNMLYSVFTPTYNVLQIPYSEENNTMEVIYRAFPTKINPVNNDPETTEVELPYQLLEPLLSYVANRIYSTMGLESGESGMYFQKFEQAIGRINNLGLFNKDEFTNQRFRNDTWV